MPVAGTGAVDDIVVTPVVADEMDVTPVVAGGATATGAAAEIVVTTGAAAEMVVTNEFPFAGAEDTGSVELSLFVSPGFTTRAG